MVPSYTSISIIHQTASEDFLPIHSYIEVVNDPHAEVVKVCRLA